MSQITQNTFIKVSSVSLDVNAEHLKTRLALCSPREFQVLFLQITCPAVINICMRVCVCVLQVSNEEFVRFVKLRVTNDSLFTGKRNSSTLAYR